MRKITYRPKLMYLNVRPEFIIITTAEEEESDLQVRGWRFVNMQRLGSRVKQIRKKNSISRAELVDALHARGFETTYYVLGALERNEPSAAIGPNFLTQLFEALAVTAEDILVKRKWVPTSVYMGYTTAHGKEVFLYKCEFSYKEAEYALLILARNHNAAIARTRESAFNNGAIPKDVRAIRLSPSEQVLAVERSKDGESKSKIEWDTLL